MGADAPADLEPWAAERLDALLARAVDAGFTPAVDSRFRPCWQQTLIASDFARDVLQRQPDLLGPSGWQFLAGSGPDVADRVNGTAAGADTEAAFMAALRRVRHREAVRLVFRSVNGLDEVPETLHRTTELYVVLLRAALARAELQMEQRHGVARNADGQRQRLVVIGMGKLGAGELNFSSDIDLIFAYPEAGQSDGPKPLENEDYFVRLGRKLVHLLSQRLDNGIVARVDMRLRPFGRAGRLALSFAAMEQYYQREGRDWERYAWIKATPVAGDLEAGTQLLETLRPFIYRKYLDYGAFAGMRKLKGKIAEQVAREDLAENLKHGPGGIREVEFCVQLLQMIRGGREPELRQHGLLKVLAHCAEQGLMDDEVAGRLRGAYLALRAAENAVQMLGDQQTHEIPDDAFSRVRIARALGFAGWSPLEADLAGHRAFVQQTFSDLLLPHAEGAEPQGDKRDISLWRHARADDLTPEMMAEAGFEPGDRGRRALLSVARSADVRMMSARSGERLDRLMPQLLAEARGTEAPLACLQRLAQLIQAVARRSAYLALLEEQPDARRALAQLFADSAFLAGRVIDQPILLDDVLDPRIEQLPLRRSDIAEEIGHALDSLDERHSEADLERLHEVRASLAFRLGMAFRARKASAPATARRLAALAAAVVAEVLCLARDELAERHGRLPGPDGGDGFAVIGYGSLGGGELGFASDLDLVFVYDQARAELRSDGPRPLEGVRWYQRLAQRVVHWLTSMQRGGRLYEVDTRLRPDGSKGMLVTSLESFADYQHQRAWIWEHQALVRARPIAGDGQLMRRFADWRAMILARPRDSAQVALEVSRMRERWRRERDRSADDIVDLKQGRGGLLDLEFLLQLLVLAHAHQHTGLLAPSNTELLLDAVAAAGLIDAGDRTQLGRAHATVLAAALHCTLDRRPRLARSTPELRAAMDTIASIADHLGLDPDPPADPSVIGPGTD